jgi:hypothetical protein
MKRGGQWTGAVCLAFGAAACTVAPTDQPGEANAQVESLLVIGTSVDEDLYTRGELGLTFVPKDAKNGAVLANDLKVDVRIIDPPGLSVRLAATQCTPKASAGQPLAVGVVLDDSGSMSSSDPQRRRKDATVAFLNGLRPGDAVLLTDYGHTSDKLRDLACLQKGGSNASCAPAQAAGFTEDRGLLVAAAEKIAPSGGTPLYEACAAMVPLVAGAAGKRQAMLLLSDGKPNSSSVKAKCVDAAKGAQLPIFTVGLGPAAQGDPKADPKAVDVLQELSKVTGGAYASADDPAQLTALFSNMGLALTQGSCRSEATLVEFATLQPGTRIKGEVTVGTKGARGTFELVTPQRAP